MNMTSVKNAKGFTLIEMLISVAIAAILAMVAFGSYQKSIEKARRVDAKSTLLEIAAEQEKFYFQENSYAGGTDGLNAIYGGTTSPDGHYNLSLANDTCDVDGACFLLTATATGSQSDDSSCTRFTLSNTGLQQAFDAATGGNDTTDLCW